ncbi:O-antigen ligase family protein [bacterium]|nr:O-antigen ligase family protein [bacterium]
MFINKFASFLQQKSEFLYENSLILQNIDKIIVTLIFAVFVLSTFVSSDVIGAVECLVILLSLLKLFTKKGEKLELNSFETVLILFLMLVLISVAGSSLLFLSIKGLLKTLTYIGFYFSCVFYFKNHKNHILPLFLTICGCLAFEGVVGLLQNYIKIGEISGWQDTSSLNPEQVMTRVYGTLKPFNPNLLSGYFVSAISVLYGMFAYYFFVEKKKRMSAILLTASVITTITMLMTGCRGGYMGWFAMVCAILIISYKFIKPELKNLYYKVLGGLAVLSASAITLYLPLRTRILSIFAFRNDSSNSFRFNVYHSCIEMFKDNWLLGIGVGNLNFREIYGLYMLSGFDALSAYNIYLETAVESGIFALLAFVAFLGTVLYKGFKFIFNSEDMKDVILVSIAVVSIIGLMMHGMVDTVFFRPQIQTMFWLMVAVISVGINKTNN